MSNKSGQGHSVLWLAIGLFVTSCGHPQRDPTTGKWEIAPVKKSKEADRPKQRPSQSSPRSSWDTKVAARDTTRPVTVRTMHVFADGSSQLRVRFDDSSMERAVREGSIRLRRDGEDWLIVRSGGLVAEPSQWDSLLRSALPGRLDVEVDAHGGFELTLDPELAWQIADRGSEEDRRHAAQALPDHALTLAWKKREDIRAHVAAFAEDLAAAQKEKDLGEAFAIATEANKEVRSNVVEFGEVEANAWRVLDQLIAELGLKGARIWLLATESVQLKAEQGKERAIKEGFAVLVLGYRNGSGLVVIAEESDPKVTDLNQLRGTVSAMGSLTNIIGL